jgi:hypothetical protein
MDPLPPIVAHQSDPPPVSALDRADRIHREGRGGSDQGGGRRRQGREDDDDAVRIAIDGVTSDADGPGTPPAAERGEGPGPHVDLTA